MTDFVDIPFTTSASDLEDAAVAYLQAQWGDSFVPADGDPEVILMEALAPMAVAVLAAAANMPKQALIALGVQLLNRPYNAGTSAYTSVVFTVKDSAGYTIDAGSQLDIDGWAFALVTDAVVPPGSTTVEQLVASTERTSQANGLTGATSTAPLMMPPFVVGMAVSYPTDDGSDPQTDDDYANQISRDRRLTSRALVTGLDFELAALDVAGISRAHATVANDGSRALTVTVLGTNGGVVASPIKTILANSYAASKTVNVTVTIADPTFNTVNVTYTAQAESGFDPTDLLARIDTALFVELSPLTHGLPQSGDPGNALTTWINDPYTYAWRLVQVIGSVAGVHRVETLSINGGANGADFALTGTVPVPEPGTFTGTIVS